MAEKRRQMSSEEMVRRAKEKLKTAPDPVEVPPHEEEAPDTAAGERSGRVSEYVRSKPLPPPPPPVRRSPTVETPKFPPPPPRSEDYKGYEPVEEETVRRTFKWARLLWVLVVVGVFFAFVGNRESVQEDSVIFREDFNEEMTSEWTWVNGIPDEWVISQGSLRLAPRLSTSSDPQPPVNLLLPSPGLPSYTFETRIDFDPWANFHAAGLIVYQDGANWIQLVQGFCSKSFLSCVDEGVYLDDIADGEFVDVQGGRALTRESDYLFLRIDLIGNAYTGWYSYDGQAWTTAGTVRRDFASPRIGIVAHSNDPQPPVSAYDYFEVRR